MMTMMRFLGSLSAIISLVTPKKSGSWVFLGILPAEHAQPAQLVFAIRNADAPLHSPAVPILAPVGTR